MLRLIVKPHRDTDRFEAFLDDELITTSRQPLLDGARKLLSMGYSGDELLTMRHHNRGYDSFKPKAIGELAKGTVKEPDRGRMQLTEWRPYNGPLSYPVASPAADNELAGTRAHSLA